ncbi:MAG TPA: ABC transporter permease, partial [Thermomicrobiales bacterium]|nr:ABC transporter permease [Thermomicrobiales bacterium]
MAGCNPAHSEEQGFRVTRYIASRLALLVPTLVGVTFLVFLGMHLMPGDPVMTMLSETNTVATPETMASIRHQLGLDRPWPVQYLQFVGRAARGDLGESWRTRESVAQILAAQFPSTLQLAVAGLGLALLSGTTLGTLAAVFHRSWLDAATMVFAMIGVSMPSFWLGLLLIYLFSVRLG